METLEKDSYTSKPYSKEGPTILIKCTSDNGKKKKIDVYSAVSLMIAIASLCLSLYTFTSYLNQQAKSKQLDAVIEIVEYIYQNPISIWAYNANEDGSSSGIKYVVSFFELYILDYIPGESKVLFWADQPYPITFTKFVNNPLVPKQIADIMTNFYSYSAGIYSNPTFQELAPFVLLSNLPYEESQILNQEIDSTNSNNRLNTFPGASAYKSWKDFVEYSKDLKYALKFWLIKNGVKDVNIRDHDFTYFK